MVDALICCSRANDNKSSAILDTTGCGGVLLTGALGIVEGIGEGTRGTAGGGTGGGTGGETYCTC